MTETVDYSRYPSFIMQTQPKCCPNILCTVFQKIMISKTIPKSILITILLLSKIHISLAAFPKKFEIHTKQNKLFEFQTKSEFICLSSCCVVVFRPAIRSIFLWIFILIRARLVLFYSFFFFWSCIPCKG